MTAATSRVLGTTQVALALDGVPESEIRLTATDLAETDPAGLIIRLENRFTGLESLHARTAAEIDRLRTEAARAREDIDKPFPQSGQLAAARDRVRRIDEQLKEAATAQQTGGHPEPTGTAAGARETPGMSASARDANGVSSIREGGHGQQWIARRAIRSRSANRWQRPNARQDRRPSCA